MFAIIRKFRRFLGLFAFSIFLLVAGLINMENNVEGAGALFLGSFFLTVFYGAITWLLNTFKRIRLSNNWREKEVWVGIFLVGIISQIGTVEAIFIRPEFTFLFALVFVFTLLTSLFNLRRQQLREQGTTNINDKKLKKAAFWTFAILGGITITHLENYGQDEASAILGVFYVPTMFFFTIRWLFNQIRSVLQLKNEKTKTELLHLKSQVNPHFFFNMLNNLYGLVGKDKDQARTVILKLSDLMRYGIYEGQKEEVTLEEEVEYLKNYIELHKMRYHKTIDIQFNTQIEQADIPIMPLLFIILLENAFKHGVENLTEGAYVHVDIQADEYAIHFRVENNFDAAGKKRPNGIGLENLKRRLALVYDNMHELSLNQHNGVYVAELSLYLRPKKRKRFNLLPKRKKVTKELLLVP